MFSKVLTAIQELLRTVFPPRKPKAEVCLEAETTLHGTLLLFLPSPVEFCAVGFSKGPPVNSELFGLVTLSVQQFTVLDCNI